MSNSKILVYTDSSYKNDVGGWSAIIIRGHKKELISGRVANYLNDSGSAEFYAVYKSFRYIIENYKNVKTITFNTDHKGIPDSFRRYFRGHEIIGSKSTIMLKKGILLMAKRLGIFIQSHHVEGHQKLQMRNNQKNINNMKKNVTTISLIQKMKYRKWMMLRSNAHCIGKTYDIFKKNGGNKSSILNNIVDAHSKKMRRKAERMDKRLVSAVEIEVSLMQKTLG